MLLWRLSLFLTNLRRVSRTALRSEMKSSCLFLKAESKQCELVIAVKGYQHFVTSAEMRDVSFYIYIYIYDHMIDAELHSSSLEIV